MAEAHGSSSSSSSSSASAAPPPAPGAGAAAAAKPQPQAAPPPQAEAAAPPAANAADDEDDDEENRVVETDPTGRYSRTAKLLGKGAYKDVFKGFDEDEGVEVAWNQLRVDHLAKREAQRILSEIQILKALRNDNIITMFHAWGAKGADGRERVFFITELMTAGTLKSYLKKTAKGQPTRLPVLKKWCRQILLGLSYLHTRNPPIIHRDLKCENIFMNSNGQAKIGDLGLAIPKSKDHASSVLGTPEFMAPELYDENYDEKVDIYAFGMVVLEMVTKEYPYSECTNQYQIYKKVTSGIRPLSLAKISDEQTAQFIELCIQFNPHLRPPASELMLHPFLKLPDGATSMSGSFSGTGASSSSSLDSGKAASLTNIENPTGDGTPTESIRTVPIILDTSERFIASPHQSMSRPSDTKIPGMVTPSLKDIQAAIDISIARSASVTSAGSTDSRHNRSSSPIPPIPLPNVASSSLVTPPSSNPPSISGGNSAPNLLTTASSSTSSLQIPSTTTPTPASITTATVTIELFDRHSENTVTLRMIYTTPPVPGSSTTKPQSHEIKFPFNLPDDTATDVVSEMVDQNLIDAKDEVLARRKLEEKIKNILLGRVEESSRRASEVPPNNRGSNSSIPTSSANTAVDTSLRDRNGYSQSSEDQRAATMPRMSSSDAFGGASSVPAPGHNTLPRANSSLTDVHFIVPRTLSNSSLSSSASSSGSNSGAGGGGRLSPPPGTRAAAFQPPPHITPSASPQPVKKSMPLSQLQQVSSMGGRSGSGSSGGVSKAAPPSSSSTAVVTGQKATFSLLSETPPPLLHPSQIESPPFAPSSSVSEGYKRGQSGSSISSISEYAHSVDGMHVRRPSQMSEGGQWGTSSGHSDGGGGVGLRPVPLGNSTGSMERVNSAASVSSVSSSSQQQQQQQNILSPTPISHAATVLPNSLPVYGPVNNPAIPPQLSTTPPSTSSSTSGGSTNSQSAAVQQRLLELQERSLKDLGTMPLVSSGSSSTSRAGTSQPPSSAPHINHHAVHHLQHHHPQFHPHHAPSSYSSANRPAANSTGSSSAWTSSSGSSISSATSSAASSSAGTPPTLSGGQRPILGAGSGSAQAIKPPIGTTPLSQSSSPNFSSMSSTGGKAGSNPPSLVGLGVNVNPGAGVVRPGFPGQQGFQPPPQQQQQQQQKQQPNRQNSH